jgi:2-(1,2-epoxy-1,2-dihydrophenyl)acetyl-CoA isomerase
VEYKTLIVTKEKGICTITLNRPEVLNAMNAQLSEELELAIGELGRDDATRVVVITGAGRAFCAGGDMKGLPISPGDVGATKTALEQLHRLLLSIRRLEKPVIAAVNGAAAGGGCDLALMCDMRIASENAKFVEAYVRIGGTSDSGGTYLLTHLVGTAKACELLLTGDTIDAGEALRIGLVNKVVPTDQLESATKELATKIASGPPMAISMMKKAIYMSLTQDIESAFQYALSMTTLCLQTEDAKEGIAAFAEKRPPVYTGK